MKNKVSIAQRQIGPGEPVFLVAETGTTCNGDLDTALRMVDAAKTAGMDAIKFMIIDPDYFMSDKSVTYEYDTASGHQKENMYEMFKALKFSPEAWQRIRQHCQDQEIIFYATIDYLPGVELGKSLDLAAYKLSSWDAANFPLARRMAQTGKPIQVDLGPTYITDIEKLLNVIHQENNDQVILVHCSHAKNNDGINIRSVPYLQDVFQVPVGYSADSREFVTDVAAVALGAHLIEKRLTLDHNGPGHHDNKALEPDELTDYVKMIRETEAALGDYALTPSDEDLRQKELYFVSIAADADIPAGTTITEDMVACKRPGNGIQPEFLPLILGRQAKRDIACNTLLSWDDV